MTRGDGERDNGGKRGKGLLKDHVWRTCGNEQKGGDWLREWGVGMSGGAMGENWKNCNWTRIKGQNCELFPQTQQCADSYKHFWTWCVLLLCASPDICTCTDLGTPAPFSVQLAHIALRAVIMLHHTACTPNSWSKNKGHRANPMARSGIPFPTLHIYPYSDAPQYAPLLTITGDNYDAFLSPLLECKFYKYKNCVPCTYYPRIWCRNQSTTGFQ